MRILGSHMIGYSSTNDLLDNLSPPTSEGGLLTISLANQVNLPTNIMARQ